MKRVFIHSGHLSADNGAVAPLSFYFNLAELLGISADPGASYWDDSLTVTDEEWPTVEQLLVEAKMLYKLEGVHSIWQNVRTAVVRKVLFTHKKALNQSS